MRELTERYKASIIDGIPGDSPVLFCPGLHGLGGKLLDRSVYANHGTISGATWVRLPKIGLYVLSFDGSNDAVSFPYNAISDLTVTLSILAWVKSSETSNFQGIIGKTGAIAGSIALYRGTTNVLTYHTYDGVGYSSLGSTATVFDGKWHLVGVTSNSLATALYVDGQPDNSATFTRVPGSGASYTWILGWYGQAGTYLSAHIGMVKLYSSVLTPAAILKQYNRERLLFGV